MTPNQTLGGGAAVPADLVARCPSCDDTGDVIRADGEWLGTCDCPAAQWQKLRWIADAAYDLINGGLVNRGNGLVVVEKADKSDPHYRLCTLLKDYTPDQRGRP